MSRALRFVQGQSQVSTPTVYTRSSEVVREPAHKRGTGAKGLRGFKFRPPIFCGVDEYAHPRSGLTERSRIAEDMEQDRAEFGGT